MSPPGLCCETLGARSPKSGRVFCCGTKLLWHQIVVSIVSTSSSPSSPLSNVVAPVHTSDVTTGPRLRVYQNAHRGIDCARRRPPGRRSHPALHAAVNPMPNVCTHMPKPDRTGGAQEVMHRRGCGAGGGAQEGHRCQRESLLHTADHHTCTQRRTEHHGAWHASAERQDRPETRDHGGRLRRNQSPDA